MSAARRTGKLLWSAAKLTGKAVHLGIQGTGKVVHEGAKFVQKHQDDIADAAAATVRITGSVVQGAGALVGKGAAGTAARLHELGSLATGKTGSVAGHAGGYLADGVRLIADATASTGSATKRVAPGVGGAVGGGIGGVLVTLSGAIDSVGIAGTEIERMRSRIAELGAEAQRRSENELREIAMAQAAGRKKDLLDLLVIGGSTVQHMLRTGQVPVDVERAFEFAYPILAASGETFLDAVQRMNANELLGLVSGVKGKLFELDFLEHLNAGALPTGMHAELASAANQPGYDIIVRDAHGHVVDLLSAKATESVSYVQDAIARYPDIHVVTTSEVHAHLVAIGASQGVSDSGTSDAVLQGKIEAAAGTGHLDLGDITPSSVALAVIALSSFMDRSLTLQQRGEEFGLRAAKTTISTAAGKAVMLATGMWWMGLIAGVGGGWLAKSGSAKRQQYEALKAALQSMESRQARLERTGTAIPYQV